VRGGASAAGDAENQEERNGTGCADSHVGSNANTTHMPSSTANADGQLVRLELDQLEPLGPWPIRPRPAADFRSSPTSRLFLCRRARASHRASA
jgi:hypothetical protein